MDDVALLRVRETGERALEHAADLGQRHLRERTGRSDPPSMYSIAMYGVPSCSK